MSRAINLNVSEGEVAAMCARHNVSISAIEGLEGGGTRVVFNNADDTAVMTKAFRAHILTGTVRRVPYKSRRG